MIGDVPSPIDLREMSDAHAWASTALQKQPTRPEFFRTFAAAISNHPAAIKRVLELGSGPGFLAEHLLNEFPQISYVALDFSNAMHALARARLGVNAVRVSFVERSFKAMDWTHDLGSFDCVVTHQAVHELRHKRHAAELHRNVRMLLRPGGVYLVCDHFAGSGGMINSELYMTRDEQRSALVDAGFVNPVLLKTAGTLAMHRVIA